MTPQKENAAPTDKRNGAFPHRETYQYQYSHGNLNAPFRSTTSNIPKPIERVCRSLGYTLWLNTPKAWLGFRIILKARLSNACRLLLAVNVLSTLNRDDALRALTEAHSYAESPLPPLLIGVMDEAAFWADMAGPEELDAYCLANFNRMHPARQSAFLNFVQGREAA